jgi:hypothetical protein
VTSRPNLKHLAGPPNSLTSRITALGWVYDDAAVRRRDPAHVDEHAVRYSIWNVPRAMCDHENLPKYSISYDIDNERATNGGIEWNDCAPPADTTHVEQQTRPFDYDDDDVDRRPANRLHGGCVARTPPA